MAEQKFPSEVIDLPSEGRLYPEGHPLKDGKIEIKYMTAKEEDILTSANLIKKGVVIDRLIDSLILTTGVKSDDLILGDKNAVMVAARILAYGPDYTCEIQNPNTGEVITEKFNLADCPFKKLPKDITENKFETTLPVSKKKIKFKLITGKEEKLITEEVNSYKKIGSLISHELTTRLKHVIVDVDGDSERGVINNFVDNMLSRDSLHLRQELNRIAPDIELSQEIQIEGEAVKVEIPMTADFFWPKSI